MTQLPALLAQSATQAPQPDSSLVLWAVILIGVAVVLFFLEVIIPSGGVIGFCSAVSLVAGIVMLFRFNTTLGLVGATLSLIAVPFMFAFALKLWKNTPIAQALLLKTPPRDTGDDANGSALASLRGEQGKAMTDLRPVGTCLINGSRHECLAETGLIESGSEVEVVSVDGNEIKVRQVGA